jgi:hypothetical protein
MIIALEESKAIDCDVLCILEGLAKMKSKLRLPSHRFAPFKLQYSIPKYTYYEGDCNTE